MEILVIIVAFWLMLVGVYGGWSLRNGSQRGSVARRAGQAAAPRVRLAQWDRKPSPVKREAVKLEPLVNEVDMLRAQVEHLRTEVVALSDVAGRYERPRTRRYRTGVYADLPRILRRQVKEVRNIRHPLSV